MKTYLLKLLSFVFLVSVGCNAYAGEWFTPLSRTDIAMQSTWLMLHTLDWGTTLDIAGRDEYFEKNPILGEHPTRGQVNLYMGLGAVVNTAIVWALPREYRTAFQAVSIGVTSMCVANNFGLGLKLDF